MDAVNRFSGLQYKEDGSGEKEYYNLQSSHSNYITWLFAFAIIVSIVGYFLLWLKYVWHELLIMIAMKSNNESMFLVFTLGVGGDFKAFKKKNLGVGSLERDESAKPDVHEQDEDDLDQDEDQDEDEDGSDADEDDDEIMDTENSGAN